MNPQRLVVGISGSSGAALGIRLLELLRPTPIETHLVVTPSARLTIAAETSWTAADVLALADVHYSSDDLAAPIASGSFDTLGMVVIPCSIKSLSAIANSYSAGLLARAADVTLKEGRPLALVVRETPLHRGHLRLMDLAARAGAIIFPPVPAFYTHPLTLDGVVDTIVGRVLRRIGIENDYYPVWQGGLAAPAVLGRAAAHFNPPGAEDLWALPAMTLATTGANGAPHAAAVYFAAGEDHTLYFFSANNSQHTLDLARDPRAAAAIHPPVEGWQAIRGLQVRGSAAALPTGAAWDAAWQVYRAKFPFVDGLREVVEQSTLYAFRLDWVRLVDNRRGFGFKEEWRREP
jgi:4-hydroxy-3-polyprenylbenzoate decarboxylase